MQHGATRAARGCSAGGEQSGQATAVLDREPTSLVHQRGGGVPAANIADEESQFFNCLHALPETTVSLIADLVEADPLPVNPYTELHRRLLAAHQLTEIQRVEHLHNLPPLAAQKPSELLAEMLRLCPRGQENNTFFNCLYLNKLPRELRILLSEADMADKQALGARADLFATHNSKQAHDVVAAVAAGPSSEQEGENTTVAAVPPGAGSGQRGGSGGQHGGGGSGQQVSHTLTHADQARMETGLCHFHFIYGAKARTCRAPCTWTEN
jgi:hypothetical protein